MWMGYVVMKDGNTATIKKETLKEMLEFIENNFYIRAKCMTAYEIEGGKTDNE